jgi:HAD superfamily hydrolase (TIGR01450 family)
MVDAAALPPAADSSAADSPAADDCPPQPRAALGQCSQPLAEAYDVALLDLDGVVYVGRRAVPGAPAALAAARSAGMRLAFVTNNAARPPAVVAAHLRELGVPAADTDVVTSAQAAARLVSQQVPAGAAVLVVGGEGLDVALREHGLRPVYSAEEKPSAVVQGFHPDVGWRLLTEGTLAVRRGLPWVASNLDRTVPTGRGLAPGNGLLVAVVAEATGRQPQVAGKPEVPLHREAMLRTAARRPLVVGDRLDTDIAGARRAGADSLLVLTGVTDPPELLAAPPTCRPTYIATDLDGLLVPHPEVVPDGEHGWRCREWVATAPPQSGRLALAGHGSAEDGLRALCAAAWSTAPVGAWSTAPGAAGAVGEALARLRW